MKMLLFIFLGSALIGSTGMASKEVGNGGDVVTCRNSSGVIQSIELLDFYEERVIRQNPIRLDPAKSVEENFKLLVDRLDSVNAEIMKKSFLTFEKEVLFLDSVELIDIPDSDHIVIPANCKIEQIVIQKEPSLVNPKRYTINLELWNRLGTVDKAGLIAHELIYKRLIGSYIQDANSIPVRYLNGTLASDSYQLLPLKTAISVLKSVNISFMKIRDFVVNIVTLTFYDGEAQFRARVQSNATIVLSPYFSIDIGVVEPEASIVLHTSKDFSKVHLVKVPNNYILKNKPFWSSEFGQIDIVDKQMNGGLYDDLVFSLDDLGKLKLMETKMSTVFILKKAQFNTANCMYIEFVNNDVSCQVPQMNYEPQFGFILHEDGTISKFGYGYLVFIHDASGKLNTVRIRSDAPTQNEEKFYVRDVKSLDGSEIFVGFSQNGYLSFALKIKPNELVRFKNGYYLGGGSIESGTLLNLQKYPDFIIHWSAENVIEFYENGILKKGTVILKKDSNGDTIPVQLEDIDGNKVNLKSNMKIELNEHGKLTSYTAKP